MQFSSRVSVSVRSRFSVQSVSDYAHVFVLISVVIVTLTCNRKRRTGIKRTTFYTDYKVTVFSHGQCKRFRTVSTSTQRAALHITV